MAHITARYIKTDDVEGELTVEDYGFFLDGGALQHVSDFWEATVAQALILDVAHAKAIDAASREAAHVGGDVELAAMADKRRTILQLSDEYLIKANIFCLLVAFFEFAILEVYLLVFSAPPSAPRPKLVEDILNPLKAEGIVGEPPVAYKEYVLKNRNAIRNAFEHGRWLQLKQSTASVDLHDTFIGVIAYFAEVEERLREKGFNP